MGWTKIHRPKGMTDRAWFQQEWGAGICILDAATVNNTFYAACEHTKEPGKVWGAVVLLQRFSKDHYNFEYKDMCEEMGPCESRCPARILDLLTPTESKYANDWRARCRERARNTAFISKLAPGQTVKLLEPMTFGGVAAQYLTKVLLPRHRNVYRTEAGNLVRFSNLADYRFEQA